MIPLADDSLAAGTDGTARPRVAMVVRNAVVHDTRVLREARTLVQRGYDVTVFGLRTGDHGVEEERDGVRIVRLSPSGGIYAALTFLMTAPRKADALWKRAVRRWFLLRRRFLGRARRQWRALVAEPGPAFVRALRHPRTALVALILIGPALAWRASGKPVPPDRDEPVPVPRGSRALGAASRAARRLLYGPRQAAFAFAFQREAGRAMAMLHPVVYHCHDFNTIWSARAARRIWPASFVYDSHEIYAHQNLAGRRPPPMRRLFVQVVEKLVLRDAQAIVTVNDSLAEYLGERHRAPLVVVRNIPERPRAEDVAEVPDALRGDGVKLLYLGGITRGRGIERTIRALTMLPEARLVLMGPVVRAEYVGEFERLAASLEVADRVTFVPPVPSAHVGPVAAHATVGLSLIENVCLSYYLSLPNKVFECLHAGIPIVASAFPEMRRIVEGYGVGAVCDPHDPRAIADAVRGVLADPAGYERMRERAREAAGDFTWDKEAVHLLELYDRLAPVRAS